MKLKVLDLFSGIGGFSLGLERTGGFETVAFCEIDEHAKKCLNKHWPDTEILNDVANLEYKKPVDLVTGGFPCQDLSFAGQGAGLAGERSGLFWYILRTVLMVGQPKLLLENVAALLDRGMGTVLGSLAEIGYDTEWHCIPANSIGAKHSRDRVWIMADTHESGWHGLGLKTLVDVPRSKEWGAIPECPSIDIFNETTIGSVPIPRELDGFPAAVDRLERIGNAVVPQIPEIIGHAILQAEGRNP